MSASTSAPADIILTSANVNSPIHATLTGTGALSLLFIHGWTCQRSYWQPQLEYFKNQHTVLALDLPGHGDSPGDENGSISGFARDVVAATAELPTPVALIGHSMGGAVALEAARQLTDQGETDKLAGVVLVDTFLINYGELSSDEIAALYQPFEAQFDDAMHGLVANCCVESTPDALRTRLQTEMSAAPPEQALPVWRSLLNWQPDAAFAAIQAPIHAINCPLIADTTRQRLRQHMTETIITDTGHFLQMERPDAFNQALEQALSAMCKD